MSAAGDVSAVLHRVSEDAAIGASAQRKAALRLLPILGIGYGLAYIDRINISFASLQMNRDSISARRSMGLERDCSSLPMRCAKCRRT